MERQEADLPGTPSGRMPSMGPAAESIGWGRSREVLIMCFWRASSCRPGDRRT